MFEDLRKLALRLGQMRIWNASLECDLKDYLEYERGMNEYMSNNSIVFSVNELIYHNTEDRNKPLGFSVRIYGITMYVNCRKAGLEPKKTTDGQ